MKKNVTNLESIRECARVAFLYFAREIKRHRGEDRLAHTTLTDMFFDLRNKPERALQEGGMNVFEKALLIGGPTLVLHWIANCYEQFRDCVEFRLKYEEE